MSKTLQHINRFLASCHGVSEEEIISRHQKDILDLLYKVLDTLDGKSAHLLRLNAIVLATLSILTGLTARHTVPEWQVNPALVFLASSLFPIGACSCALWIFRIKWPFLSSGDSVIEFTELGKVCDDRHKWHNLVWILSLVSLVLLPLNLLFATVFL